MKHILVPTDFSDCALSALKVAAQLAKRTGATIHLAHVYEKPVSGTSVQLKIEDEAIQSMMTGLEAELKELAGKDFLDGVDVKHHVIVGKKPWEVLNADGLSGIDFIVIGSHGSSGAEEVFIGSNTQKVIQKAKVPVMVVKFFFKIDGVENIVFASNFSEEESQAGFKPIKSLANLLDANIHLLKVITPANFEETSYTKGLIESFAKKAGLNDYTSNIYNSISVESGIYQFSDMIEADIIAIETHGRKGLGHFVVGSIAEDIANHADLPIITTQIKEEN